MSGMKKSALELARLAGARCALLRPRAVDLKPAPTPLRGSQGGGQ